MTVQNFVIIGGGVAGLAAAARLAELGAKPLLLEAGIYPTHKVCGEFFSPECLPFLEKWKIKPIYIQQAYLRTPNQTLHFPFPQPAASLSHLEFDPLLADYGRQRGLTIRTQVKVQSLFPKKEKKELHQIELSTGEKIQAHSLLIATGRIPQLYQSSLQMPYIGIKAHFEQIPIQHTLEMFCFSQAYVGIAPIENQKFNIACLAKRQYVEAMGSSEAFMQKLMEQHPLFKFYLSNGKKIFSEWMKVPVPFFGIKKTPKWLDTYFIGDAAGTIPPACGNGLSMSITSGYLAANYAIREDYIRFKKDWHSHYAPQIFWGKGLHHMMLNPHINAPLFKLASYFPSLASLVFRLTRQVQ